jgi:hypothetical protein
MRDDIAVIYTYSSEFEAAMGQELLRNEGITAFIFKDDAGGMEPQLQLTNGVRLVVALADAERAAAVIQASDSDVLFI